MKKLLCFKNWAFIVSLSLIWFFTGCSSKNNDDSFSEEPEW